MQLPSDNNLYFACIDLTDRPCLVVGGGEMALEKVEGLLGAGARVTVIARDPGAGIRSLASEGRVELLERKFEDPDVARAWVVIASTGDESIDRRVAAAAEERNKLVNVADVPDLCNFILPAIVRDGPIAVGISTAGASPALAQRMKREIGAVLERPFGLLAAKLRDLRPWARRELETYEQRRDFFRGIVDADPDPVALLENERGQELDARIETLKAQSTSPR